MDRQKIIIIALVILIITAGIFLFTANFELVDEEITTGYSDKAIRNHFLAAERFLTKLNYSVSSHQEHYAFDNIIKKKQYGSILMSYNAQLESKKRYQNLMDWIRNGGHLILELNASLYPKETDIKHGLLKEFNLSLKRKNFFLDDVGSQHTDVQIYQDGESFDADFLSGYTIDVGSSDYTVKAGDENGTHLVEFRVGEGSITMMSDIQLWYNRNIAENDHAALLMEVLGRNPGMLDIITEISMPSLIEIIWTKSKWFCVSLILLIAFYVWSLFEKFGPAQDKIDHSRRSLVEHLDAAAKFDWRHFRGATLLESARNDLKLFIENKFPSVRQKDPEETWQWLHEKTDIAVDDIRNAFSGECNNAAKLIHAIQIIQKIRKQLS